MKIYLGDQAVGLASYVELADAENLDDEIYVQDGLINQLTQTLRRKGAGLTLPELDNPAPANKIIQGYQAIDSEGKLIIGTSKAIETEDATATAETILKGETAYVKGEKVTGTYEGMEINGIIESYKVAAGETISAGDFVSFVNNYKVGDDYSISSTNYTGNGMSCVALDNNRVFIAHTYPYSSSSTTRVLYGVICTINGSNITVGTDTVVYKGGIQGNDCYPIDAVLLSENKVFITHSYSGYLNCSVCVISGSTISSKATTELDGGYQTGYAVSTVRLNNNTVFIANGSGDSQDLYGKLCEINGTSVTLKNDEFLSSSTYDYPVISAVALSESKVFVAFGVKSDMYLYGIVCNISGTTITTGNEVELIYYGDPAYALSVVALDENRVFIAHSGDADHLYLYGLVCTINGTTIAPGEDIQLSNLDGSGCVISATSSGNRVFIVHSENSIYFYLRYMELTINGSSIIVDHSIRLSDIAEKGNQLHSTLLPNGDLFIAHCESHNSLNGLIIQQTNGVISLSDTIFGIAKESGSGGQEIEVYVPA